MAMEQFESKIDQDDRRSALDVAAEGDDGDIDIEVVDDTPVEDRGRTPMPPGDDDEDDRLESYSESVRKRISKLNKRYHDERREKETARRQNEEAVRIAARLREENQRLQQAVNRSDSALIDQARQRAEATLAQAREKYKRAYEEGDSDAIVESQEAMSAAVAERDRLASWSVPSQPTSARELPSSEARPAQSRPDPKVTEWVKKNSWFQTDSEMTGYALGLHERLVRDDGLDPTSDEYYRRIDAGMRKTFPDRFDDDDGEDVEFQADRSEDRGQKKPVVASAARSGARPRTVRLTATQVALARRLGISPQQYAQELLKGSYS